ncbi:MAG TPA: beta-ketoacyl-[acyl-carrier-protein] synthase family protein [Longimicrobiales bacterium]|nr:beta-ketoacyl-[acyl-carrier-protein] synthase family protein [Longimicrobiales bacterium]
MSVVVTGMGVVCATAIGRDAFARALQTGRCGAGILRGFDASGFPVRIACEVDDSSLPDDAVPAKARKLMSRATLFAAVAARLASDDAGLAAGVAEPERVGVAFGAGGMGSVDREFLETQLAAIHACEAAGGFTWDRFSDAYQRLVNPLAAIRALPNLAAGTLGILHDAQGPNLTVATACTSGTQAIGEALRALQRDEVDVMITGGADAMVNPTGVLGFHLLGALSRRNDDPEHACRPFDQARDGFVIGEGAGALVLEREEFARARGACVVGRVTGYASACDAYRMTDERPDASGAARTMRTAVRDARLAPGDIGYINAHGTGTRMNDRLETLAIRTVFGGSAPPTSSTKSMVGHVLAGAGAVEAIATLIALAGGWLPPTINYTAPDPECDLDYVPNVARPATVQAALSNSFGFGGQNACLVLQSP